MDDKQGVFNDLSRVHLIIVSYLQFSVVLVGCEDEWSSVLDAPLSVLTTSSMRRDDLTIVSF